MKQTALDILVALGKFIFFFVIWFLVILVAILLIPKSPDEKIGKYDLFGESSAVVIGPSTTDKIIWRDSGIITTGKSIGAGGLLQGVVSGYWKPWASDLDGDCDLLNCAVSFDANKCLAGAATSTNTGRYVDSKNVPCTMKRGQGLYGLIAMPFTYPGGGEVFPDPNKYDFRNLPPEYFRTFHVAEFHKENIDEYSSAFSVDKTLSCVQEGGDFICNEDEQVRRGRLYFGIYDVYGNDDRGEYKVQITSGHEQELGFIDELINEVMYNLRNLVAIFEDKILAPGSIFVNIIQITLLLYVSLTGLLFLMGLIRTHVGELVIRTLKLGIVFLVISEPLFLTDNIFPIFTRGSIEVSNVFVAKAFQFRLVKDAQKVSQIPECTPGNPSENEAVCEQKIAAIKGDDTEFYQDLAYSENQYVTGSESSSTPKILVVFDKFLDILFSPVIHKKIWAAMISPLFIFIPILYYCLYLLILSILKGLVIYTLALVQMFFVLSLFPIFIILMLFQITTQIFDEWLKQLLSTSIVIVLMGIIVALYLSVIVNTLYYMFEYSVSVKGLSDIIPGAKIFTLWTIDNYADFMRSWDMGAHILPFILLNLLFLELLSKLPEFADALSLSVRAPVTMVITGSLNAGQELWGNIRNLGTGAGIVGKYGASAGATLAVDAPAAVYYKMKGVEKTWSVGQRVRFTGTKVRRAVRNYTPIGGFSDVISPFKTLDETQRFQGASQISAGVSEYYRQFRSGKDLYQ
jgi:type IV secretion system protein VirB6